MAPKYKNSLKRDKPREHCAVFGIACNDITYSVSKLLYRGLISQQHRGQESTGISILKTGGRIFTYKKNYYFPIIEGSFIFICVLLTIKVIIEMISGNLNLCDTIIVITILLPVSIFVYFVIIVKFFFTDNYAIYEKGIIIYRGKSYNKEWRKYKIVLEFKNVQGYISRGFWFWFLPKNSINHPWVVSQIKPEHRKGPYYCGYGIFIGVSNIVPHMKTKRILNKLMKENSIKRIPINKQMERRELKPEEIIK